MKLNNHKLHYTVVFRHALLLCFILFSCCLPTDLLGQSNELFKEQGTLTQQNEWFKEVQTLDAGNHQLAIATQQFGSGTYLLRLVQADGSYALRKFVIQR